MSSDTVDGFTQLPTTEELGLENQLLALEVRVLRGRDRALAEQQARTRTEVQAPAVPDGMVLISKEDHDDLNEAKRNLKWLIRRVGSGPLGWFVRTRSGYQNLASRWLDGEGDDTSEVASTESE